MVELLQTRRFVSRSCKTAAPKIMIQINNRNYAFLTYDLKTIYVSESI